MPNNKTHPAFGDALAGVAKAGVKALAFDCVVKPSELVIDKSIAVKLCGALHKNIYTK